LSDGEEVTVGYYYPKEKNLQLIGKGNLWPGIRTVEQFLTI